MESGALGADEAGSGTHGTDNIGSGRDWERTEGIVALLLALPLLL
jgi:hypothetical protein